MGNGKSGKQSHAASKQKRRYNESVPTREFDKEVGRVLEKISRMQRKRR